MHRRGSCLHLGAKRGYLPQLEPDPLDVLDPQTRLATLFDDWVSTPIHRWQVARTSSESRVWPCV